MYELQTGPHNVVGGGGQHILYMRPFEQLGTHQIQRRQLVDRRNTLASYHPNKQRRSGLYWDWRLSGEISPGCHKVLTMIHDDKCQTDEPSLMAACSTNQHRLATGNWLSISTRAMFRLHYNGCNVHECHIITLVVSWPCVIDYNSYSLIVKIITDFVWLLAGMHSEATYTYLRTV